MNEPKLMKCKPSWSRDVYHVIKIAAAHQQVPIVRFVELAAMKLAQEITGLPVPSVKTSTTEHEPVKETM